MSSVLTLLNNLVLKTQKLRCIYFYIYWNYHIMVNLYCDVSLDVYIMPIYY